MVILLVLRNFVIRISQQELLKFYRLNHTAYITVLRFYTLEPLSEILK
jgi:hypothetical protein